jgi:hypothetical protein
MDAHDRLTYYKRLQADGIALSAGQKSDMLQLIKERGEASAAAAPASGAKHEELKRKY